MGSSAYLQSVLVYIHLRFLVFICGLYPGCITKVKCGWCGFNCGDVVVKASIAVTWIVLKYVLGLMSSLFYSNYLFCSFNHSCVTWHAMSLRLAILILRHGLHWMFLLQIVSKQNIHGSCHWHRLMGTPDTWICSCKRWRILLQCFSFDLFNICGINVYSMLVSFYVLSVLNC